MAGGPKMSHRMEAAIGALLASQTQAEAAAKAGISKRTLTAWLAEEAFAAAYARARSHLRVGVVGDLVAAGGAAVKTLADNLSADRAADQNTAARTLLDYMMRGADFVDLAERVESLEEQLDDLRRQRGGTDAAVNGECPRTAPPAGAGRGGAPGGEP